MRLSWLLVILQAACIIAQGADVAGAESPHDLADIAEEESTLLGDVSIAEGGAGSESSISRAIEKEERHIGDMAGRVSELGESGSGVDLINGLFRPSALGASAAPSAKPSAKTSAKAISAKEVKRIRAEIKSASARYRKAKQRGKALDRMEAKQAKGQSAASVGVKKAKMQTPPMNDTFRVTSEHPWRVQLLHANGTAKQRIKIPHAARNASESTHAAIVKEALHLSNKTVETLEAQQKKRQNEQRDVLMHAEQETLKFKAIDTKLKRHMSGIDKMVAEKAKEIASKAREIEKKKAAMSATTGKAGVAARQQAASAKESLQKSKEGAVKVRKDGKLAKLRDRSKVIITRKPPPQPKVTPGVPAGPPTYARFSNTPLDPIVQLSTAALENSPDFQDWAKAKPAADVATATRIRKKAHHDLLALRVKSSQATSEISLLSNMLLAKCHALAALNAGSSAAQKVGRQKFEEQAMTSITMWARKLKAISKEKAKCKSVKCKEGTWRIWNRMERVTSLLASAEADFMKWAQWMQLSSGAGHQAYKSAAELKLWAQLYELKDDLMRRLPAAAAIDHKVAILTSAHIDRIADELKAQQVARAMSRFPIPDRLKLPIMVNGSKIEGTVDTEVWAKCRCALKMDAKGKVTCPYCNRELWSREHVYEKYGEKNIVTRFSLQRLLWAAQPRKNPIVCDLEFAPSVQHNLCTYKCQWYNVYGNNWYHKQKSKLCMKFQAGPKQEQCKHSFISIPMKTGPLIKGAACEAQMSLSALYEQRWKRIHAKPPPPPQLGETPTVKKPQKAAALPAGSAEARASKGKLTAADKVIPDNAVAAKKESAVKSLAKQHEEMQTRKRVAKKRAAAVHRAKAQARAAEKVAHHMADKAETTQDAEEVKRTEKQAAKREKKINHIWDKEAKSKQGPWVGWKCIRSSGEGTVSAYECTLLDNDIGFVGIKGATRLSRSDAKGNSVCVAWERVKPQSRSACSCCPRFSCKGNCLASYNQKSRLRYDNMRAETCNARFPTTDTNGTPLPQRDIQAARLKRQDCKAALKFNKVVRNKDNVDADLAQEPTKKALPIWEKFGEQFGSKWTETSAARRWYCKTMWKYSTVDLRNLTKLTAPHTGYCSAKDDAQVHSKGEAGMVAQCEKKVATGIMVSASPFQVSDAQFAIYSDEQRSVRPAGVVWPRRDPPQTLWPSRRMAPDLQPSRLPYCTECCAQLYPKKKGCPSIGKVMTSGGAKYSFSQNFPMETMRNAGNYEWELTGRNSRRGFGPAPAQVVPDKAIRERSLEPLQEKEAGTALGDEVSLISEEARDPNDPALKGDKFQPGFTWATSRWGRRRRRRRRRWVFARRRRRYFNSPVEKAAKVARTRARDAAESTRKLYERRAAHVAELQRQMRTTLKLQTQKAQRIGRELGKTAYDAAKAKKLSESMAHELKLKAEMKAKAATKQKLAAVKQKFTAKITAMQEKAREAHAVMRGMANKKRKVREDTREVRIKAEAKAAHWSRKAERAANRLAKKYQASVEQSKQRYEVIGYQKDRLAKAIAKLKSAKARAELDRYARDKLAVNMKLLKAKAEGRAIIVDEDIDDLAKKAARKVDTAVADSRKATGKALDSGWQRFLDRSMIEMNAGNIKVKTPITDLQFNIVKALRKAWWKNQCTTKAADVYFRMLVEKEAGHTDARGRFFKAPKCEQLKSYMTMCDADYIKKCTTITTPTVDTNAKFKCVQTTRAEIVELHKTVFCPRITNNSTSPSAGVCQVRRKCSTSEGGATAPNTECALF